MKIEILETGCVACFGLEGNVREALQRTGKSAELININELGDIIEKGVMSTPAIIIDGETKSSGQDVSVEKIVGWLNET